MKLQLVPKDAVGFEKFVYVLVELGVPILYIVLGQFSVWGIWHNILSANAQSAAPFWHIIGFVLFVFSVVFGYLAATDSNYVTKSGLANVFILWASMVLSIAASCGFHFNG